MAAEVEMFCDNDKYQRCFTSLVTFVYKDEDSSRTNLNVLLDELNSVDYSQSLVSREDGNRLIIHLCKTIPFHQERILTKACQTIINLSVRQQVLLYDHHIEIVVEFLITALQRCPNWTHADILHSLTAVLYNNIGKVSKFYDILLGKDGILPQLVTDPDIDEDVFSGAVQCLENLTTKVPGQDYLPEEYYIICYNIFVQVLHNVPKHKMDPSIQNKILICALRGLHNILLTTKINITKDLGPLLAAVRAYIHHGLGSQPSQIPESLCPTPLSQYDPNPAKPAAKQTATDTEQKETDSNKESGKNKGKKNRKKKQEKSETAQVEKNVEKPEIKNPAKGIEEDSIHLRPSWAKFHSSDSEYSDTEAGQSSRVRSAYTKVRQCALNCLHTIIKNTDKKIIFGYWSSFIPDVISGTNATQSQTLFTSILKDPAPKCRMGALATLTAMIDGTKPYLAAAEDSMGSRSAFTSFSAVLGSMIKELHRCLLMALVAENYPVTLTQLIKCIGMLLSNAPYHRLQPGLLSRTVKQIRHFLQHRDPNVRVACLTCLGAIVSIQPPLLEICHIVQPSRPPVGTRIYHSGENTMRNSISEDNSTPTRDSGFNSQTETSTSNGSLENNSTNQKTDNNSGSRTPVLGACTGIQTPVFSDQTLQNYAHDTSWVIKLCIKNVLSQKADTSVRNDFAPPWETPQQVYEPIPVRLESLQVLANLTKGYFPILRKSVILMKDLILSCLADTDPVVKLHGTKLLDELSQVMLQEYQNATNVGPEAITKQQMLEFWMSFLNGPLPGILQSDGINPVRANACDCISNVGMDVFKDLPCDKRIMCITLVLGLTNDDDKLVKSAAVRALGVYILYPCLKENVNFVADTANAVLMCMEDSSINVRMKAAWAMANLCDALVLNKDTNAVEFIEDFSDMLLLKLLMTATKSSQDSDKVKSNAVRAVGNALRYLPHRSLGKSNFTAAIQNSVQILVKNILSGTMKVRWNACYAISNMFKNNGLPHGKTQWTIDIIHALGSVVKECKNFKVRINAALALSSLKERGFYGDVELFTFVWNSLIVALKTSEDITDFAEFKYRDNLTEQIIQAILHCVSILLPDDLTSLVPSLQQHNSLLQPYLYKLQKNDIIKTDMETAINHLTEQMDKLTTPEQTEAFSMFSFVFMSDQESFVDELEPKGMTSFQQIYD
ncbi:hypothetical protein SNE40_006730 [Patella caerulea]|uniref:HEAT repeat-containing protein 6 n=1 Tax=Patella caerulea TaxID=87958 RepID=A0AAN8JY62_PATCE